MKYEKPSMEVVVFDKKEIYTINETSTIGGGTGTSDTRPYGIDEMSGL